MIFPLGAAALVVVINGSVVRSYEPAMVVSGHVVAPVEPYLTSAARIVARNGKKLIARRGDRFAQVAVGPNASPATWNSLYIEIVPVLRSLGALVQYDPLSNQLSVNFPAMPVETPTPFNPAVPSAAPTVVFTPAPVPTPRPVVTGKPSPRRTPLPCCTQSSRLH